MQCRIASVLVLATAIAGAPAQSTTPPTVQVHTRDGKDVEGALTPATLTFTIDGKAREVAVADLLSFHSAQPASATETAHIEADLKTLTGTDLKAAEAATAELTDIGLPVLSPLLASYADTDAHEPDPRYRLFARLVPPGADALDRGLDLIRLADGEVLRGKWTPVDLQVSDSDGRTVPVAAADVRRLAVLREHVERNFDLQALHDCTYVSWVDTGVLVTKQTHLQSDARGLVRLSFDIDGWAADPDGIKEPLPGKRKLQEGFRWGCVLGRVGTGGERWFAGKHADRSDLADGRLYFVVNDNEHWQNNIGSYRVRVTASHAYDVGEAQ
jgi:hypothetical protein